jgi:hypothetical protein
VALGALLDGCRSLGAFSFEAACITMNCYLIISSFREFVREFVLGAHRETRAVRGEQHCHKKKERTNFGLEEDYFSNYQ